MAAEKVKAEQEAKEVEHQEHQERQRSRLQRQRLLHQQEIHDKKKQDKVLSCATASYVVRDSRRNNKVWWYLLQVVREHGQVVRGV